MFGPLGGATRRRRAGPPELVVAVFLALFTGSASAQGPSEQGAQGGFPDNPVSDYLDQSSDGLNQVEVPGTPEDSVTSVEVPNPDAAPVKKPKPAEWMLVPIPNYNPTLGFMVNVTAAYLFPMDAASPSSSIAGIGMYSTNNSWVFGTATRLFLGEDHYRVTALLIGGHINWDFYGVGNEAADRGLFVPISQYMVGGRLESLFRIAQGLYLGPRWTLFHMNATADLSQVEFPPEAVPPNTELKSWFSSPGIKFQWDTRDSVFFPRRGQLMELAFDAHLKALGDSFDYLQGKISWNQYLGLTPRQVLAFREMVSFVAGSAPFYSLPRLGQGSDIRGFRAGEYQDNILLAVQTEYRLQILPWLGGVAFFGVGEVEPDVGSLSFKDLLPAGGLGVRITVAKQNHVNARADVAFSKQGVSFYLGVGEAF